MKKLLLFFYFAFCILNFALSQNPLVKQWDKRFGGTDNDYLNSFKQTADGGFILGGRSYSDSSGNKTQHNWGGGGGTDFWIVKIDSLGNKQWDKDFGGTGADNLYSLQQTSDGGYILGGNSTSGISGDKTQPAWGGFDYWIVKIDSLGNKQWDKDFGGQGGEVLNSLQQTSDKGYILGGWTNSGIGGDITQALWGSSDYWIVKTDSVGNKQWAKNFGGISSDEMYSLQQSADGGYILGGTSYSDSSGDKTQPTWGAHDYWVVKIDSLGNKQWDKDFGGISDDVFRSLQQTNDKGYILGGYSWSGISGDKTQANWDPTDSTIDYWIIRTDSLGNKQWDKDFGGTNDDAFNFLQQTPDQGYLFSGASLSNISGNKTENNLGPGQAWLVKTDSIGIKQWDKTIFTTGTYDQCLAYQSDKGCYVIANFTYGGIGGYKTQPNWGATDYWIIKFCDTTLTTNLTPALSKEEGVVIAPNPFTDEITITVQKQMRATFTVKNILGQTVLRHEGGTPLSFGEGQGVRFDLSFLSKGIYLLDIVIDPEKDGTGGERMVKKIVKE